MSLNRIDLLGRLGGDVELRYTNSQKPVATFNIAVDRDGKDAGTDWITIVAWNATANFAHDYFHKGDPIAVSGRLQMRSWEDKNGNRRTSAEVVADRIYFVPKGGSSRPETTYGETSYPPANNGGYSPMTDADDGILPF